MPQAHCHDHGSEVCYWSNNWIGGFTGRLSMHGERWGWIVGGSLAGSVCMVRDVVGLGSPSSIVTSDAVFPLGSQAVDLVEEKRQGEGVGVRW